MNSLQPTKLIVTWDEYHHLIEQLARQIHQSGWQCDAIIALARGGLRVGDILSRLFRVPMGVWYTSAYRAQHGTAQETLFLGEHIACAQPLHAERVLLVDDLVDSGNTLQAAIRAVPQHLPHAQQIRSAVLWIKPKTCIHPDYAVQTLPDNPWIVQPFERYDSLTVDHLTDTL